MAKNRKRSAAAKKVWAMRRKNALAKQEPKIGSKIRIKMPEDYRPLLDGPLLEINAEAGDNPEPGPAIGTQERQLNLRETVEAIDKLLANLYSLLG